MKVRNMTGKTGNKVAHQLIIETDNSRYFQSYGSVIIKEDFETGKTFLDETFYKYSKTTIKYRNQFLGETTKEIDDKVKTGKYILTSLNGR